MKEIIVKPTSKPFKKKHYNKVDGPTMPPWSTPLLWQEINQSLAIHLRLHHDHLIRARISARLIQKNFQRLFPLMEDLCLKVCLICKEKCCRHAKPWYDFRDLIYLHLCELDPPNAQPIGHVNNSCRYLTSDGCGLPREIRPWICTWYICPDQNNILKMGPYTQNQAINSTLLQIKSQRKTLENEFIQAIA